MATHVTNDLEAPALFLPSLACCYEVRFTDREVILARADHEPKLSNVQEGTFSANVSLLLPGGAVYTEKRGWLSVDGVRPVAEHRRLRRRVECGAPAPPRAHVLSG